MANQLQQARSLLLPKRQAMLDRAPSVQQFWETNKGLLSNAWKEWENSETSGLLPLGSALLDSRLREAVEEAWKDPSKELAVHKLWQQVTPDVYTCQFFDPQRLRELRDYLELAWDAQIPLRPPYGIVLNRKGAMLDSRSNGYLAAPNFQQFYRQLIDDYMRPIARLLFPEIIGFDTQSFGFSINYQPDTDTSIRPHTDASAVTLNINVNLPGEAFSGSTVNFFDSSTGETHELAFQSGTAMIHRGNVPHAAMPITSGERTNLVLWLYGDSGRMPNIGKEQSNAEARERWSKPNAKRDTYAPF